MAITWECSRGDCGYLYASVYCVDAIKYWSGSKTNAGDTTGTSGEKDREGLCLILCLVVLFIAMVAYISCDPIVIF